MPETTALQDYLERIDKTTSHLKHVSKVELEKLAISYPSFELFMFNDFVHFPTEEKIFFDLDLEGPQLILLNNSLERKISLTSYSKQKWIVVSLDDNTNSSFEINNKMLEKYFCIEHYTEKIEINIKAGNLEMIRLLVFTNWENTKVPKDE